MSKANLTFMESPKNKNKVKEKLIILSVCGVLTCR